MSGANGERFTINSDITKKAFHKFVDDLFDEKKFLTFKWVVGADRSLDQNALFHVWCTEYAAHILGISKNRVLPEHIEGMKRRAKKGFYREFGRPWMIGKVYNFSTKETELTFASSKDYKTPEMFEFLTWFQSVAMSSGCILESKGKFNKLQREQLSE